MRRLLSFWLLVGVVSCGGGGGGPTAPDTGAAPATKPDAAAEVATPAPDVAAPGTDVPQETQIPPPDAGLPSQPDVMILEPTDALEETDAAPVPAVVREGVRVLPDDGSLMIAEVTETTVTLRGTMPPMAVGNVIVSAQGEGLARRVMAITPSGADTVLTTQPAALSDIFSQGELVVDRVFGPDDMSSVMPAPGMASGETVLPFIIQPLGVSWFTVPFNHLFLDHPSGKVRLEGSAGIGLGLNVKAELQGWGLSKLRVVPSVHGQLKATFTAQVTAKSTNHRLPLGAYNFKSFTVNVGVVPVVLTPSIDLYAVSNLDVQAGAKLTFGLDAMAQGGFEWKPGSLRPVIGSTVNATFGVDGQARVSGDIAIRPELSLKVYGVKAAYAGVDLPHMTATVATVPGTTALSVYAAARLKAGAGFLPGIFDRGGNGGYWNLLETPAFVITNGQAKTLYNLVGDFSSARNPNGSWTYGYMLGMGQPFRPYTNLNREGAIVAWVDPARGNELSVFFNESNELLHPAGTVNLAGREFGLHPGPAGEVSAVRFAPTVAGNYRFAIVYKGMSGYAGAPATSTSVGVIKDGTTLHSATLNQGGTGNTAQFYFDAYVGPSSVIDFVVGNGNGDHRWDSTGLHVEASLL
ncbi:MAG TPA: hypothetical protein VGG33_27745 [Polyangia bacterium]